MKFGPGRFFGLLVVVVAPLAGCAARRDAVVRLDFDVVRPDACVVVFFVDGLDYQRFSNAVGAGELPQIQRWFVEGGVCVRHAVASLPPITYPNAVSIITGMLPGHHGVLGNRWFDRGALMLRDYGSASTYQSVNDDFAAPTLYEFLGDRFGVNVQGHTRRGVTETIDHKIESGLDWFLGDFSDTDERVGWSVEQVASLARRRGCWPSLYVNYFLGIDEIGHRFGPDSAEYQNAMRVVDGAIGRIVGAIEAAQPAAQRYYVLLTDHSHLQVGKGKSVDIADRLARRYKLRVAGGCEYGSNKPGNRTWNRYDAIVIVGAYRRASIHLRGPNGWNQAPTRELLAALLNSTDADGLVQMPGVDLVCTRAGGDRVKVVSRRGMAIVERRIANGPRQYRLIGSSGEGSTEAAAGELFGYDHDPTAAEMLDGDWHDSRRWLAATAHTDYPDFVPQVVEMFDSPRAGDVVIFAADDYSFDSKSKGSHGAALASDMKIPLYFAGPGLSAGATIDCGRLVDVMPTILDLLGAGHALDQAAAIDGTSLLDALRSAERSAP